VSSPTAQGSEYLLGWNHIAAVGFLKGFLQKPLLGRRELERLGISHDDRHHCSFGEPFGLRDDLPLNDSPGDNLHALSLARDASPGKGFAELFRSTAAAPASPSSAQEARRLPRGARGLHRRA